MVEDTHTAVADTRLVVADTHTVVADTHTAVTDTRMVVAGTHSVVADTHTMVADIHRSVLTGQEGGSCKHHSVCAARHRSTTNFLLSLRLKPGQDIECHRIPSLTFSLAGL